MSAIPRLSMPQVSMPQVSMPQVETVVMLMLENRSLDNVLGWLHRDGKPVHIVGDPNPPHFDGLSTEFVNYRKSRHSDFYNAYWPTEGFSSLGPRQEWRSPRWDPKEGMANVEVQMYGDRDGEVTAREWGNDAQMKGFAYDYPTHNDNDVGDVMGGYTRDELPVLYGLAENFAVSDRWFSSVPTETDPNRAFSLCGTAQGDEYELPAKIFTAPTIFNALNPSSDSSYSGKTWGIFHQGDQHSAFKPKDAICYTQGRFTQVQAALSAANSTGNIDHLSSLLEKLRGGDDVPEFCYIEPAWGWGIGMPDGDDYVGYQGNDYHAPTWLGPAEWDLNELYVALRASKQWDHMLFIIVFDEHGGTFDHVAPPATVNPDGIDSHFPVHFDYTRLGPRVPAILVSPFVAPGTVFRAPADGPSFDHTSVIRTVLEWAGAPISVVETLGARVGKAPTFDTVLSPMVLQPAAPCTFNPPTSFETQCPKGEHLPFAAPGLSVEDHRVAVAMSSDIEGYLAILKGLAAAKR
jgi:phospholipase C